MDIVKREEAIPMNMRYLILLASFLTLPVFVAEQRLLKEKYILCSFAGYMIGPYLALVPISYKIRFMIGSACSMVPYFFSFIPTIQAFLLGLIVSYYRLVVDLFCLSLCVKTKKKRVVILSNVIAGWMSFLAFFSFRFWPLAASTLCTPFVTIVCACFGTFISYRFIIETPEEIFKRYTEAEQKSDAYEDLYRCIVHINGAEELNIDEFREDYRSFLNEKTQIETNGTFRERVTAIALSINVSFIYIAFQRAAGIENKFGLYRLFLGCMQLISWSLKYTYESGSIYVSLIPPFSLFFVCISTNNNEDMLLAFIMLFGTGFVRTISPSHTLTYVEMALSRSTQYIFVTIVFLVLVFFFLN
ncbi:hypothetical protein NEIRO03_0080 [Nematocida sp. AWRm78]|nr:hypothetical protein NEIRO02_0107 [Nematocida sp. AWRm79]KAI5182396.1 hypothetical protein NEIRO03_0080 [Nematocida sp. AWRm78]